MSDSADTGTLPPDEPDAPDVASADENAMVATHPRPPRPGDLSVGWRATTACVWIGVILALASVWNASVQLGLSTWWLGPRADPQPRVVQFSPFFAPVLMLLGTINQIRWLGWIGLGASGIVAAVGFADLDRVISLALVELAIAAAAALASVASLTGTYRAGPASAPVDSPQPS